MWVSRLRVVLLVATALALIFSIGLTLEDYRRFGRLREPWGLVIAVALALNLTYLLFSSPNEPPGRIRRLFSAWLDAKESELKRRAKADP